MYQRTGPNPELLELLARYLAGHVPLEAAANQWAQVYTALMQRPSLDASPHSEFTGGDGLPPFKEADRPKVYALLERVQTKLDAFVLEEIHESAREYVGKAGDAVFDKTVRLLANDVANTLGQQHVAIVWSYAGQFRDSSPGLYKAVHRGGPAILPGYVRGYHLACLPRAPKSPVGCR